MSRSSQMGRIGAGAMLLALGACAATPKDGAPAAQPPVWFAEAQAAAIAQGYPDLADVPSAPRALPASDPAWDVVEAELVADREALQGNERASPAPANAGAQADAFRDDAVRTIEQTRERY